MCKSLLPEKTFSKWVWLLLIVVVLGVLLLSLKRHFGHDEFEGIHTGWKILQGERIYLDFFQHHHPFYYYLPAFVISVAGETVRAVIALRLVSFAAFTAMLLLTWRLAMRIYGRHQVAKIALVLLAGAFIFFDSAIEIRPDVPQVFFGFAGFVMIFAYFDEKKKSQLILSALCLALSFLFLQKAVFSISVMGILLMVSACKKQIKWVDVAIYSLTGAAVVMPYFIYLICSGTLDKYIEFNWLLNMKFMNEFSAINGIGVIFCKSPALLLFYVRGLVKHPKTSGPVRLGWVSLGLLASVFLVRSPYNQYFLPAIPFMAVIAANAIVEALRDKGRWHAIGVIASAGVGFIYAFRIIYPEYKAVVIPMVIILCHVIAIVFCKYRQVREKWLTFAMLVALIVPVTFVFNRIAVNNTIQLAIVEYVRDVTSPQDYVYDGDAQFNLFRKDVDYFWFSVRHHPRLGGALMTYQSMTDYHYDIYELIERYKPKVIWEYQVDVNDPRIAAYYAQSAEYGAIYIRK